MDKLKKMIPGVSLSLLGWPRVEQGGEDRTRQIKYRKGLALLGYLAVHGGVRHSRERLAELLWPALDLVAARTNLRQVLNNLGRVLNHPAELLQKDAAVAGLFPGADTWMDIDLLADGAVDRLARETPEARSWRLNCLEPRVGTLGEEFLAGLQLTDTPEFDEWLDAMRMHYQTRSILLLERLCTLQRVEGRLTEAVSTARRLVSLGPFNEAHHQQLMSLLAESGDASGALEVFAELRRRLETEMGVLPGPTLLALRERIARRLDNCSASLQETGGAEVRQLSLLYCTSEALQDDEADRLFAESMQAAVKRRGGMVISGVGRGVLAVFGMGDSTERASQRAVLAARDLLPGGICPVVHLPRIGISAGRVLLRPAPGGPHLAGEIPDLAKLIGWSAQPGEVLVSEAVAHHAGEWFSFESAGERVFPGLEGGQPLYRLAGASAIPRSVPIPLAGRQQELEQLLACWEEACAGRPSLVILRAPAGVGKTRLAGELALQVAGLGGRVRRIRCALEHQHQPLAALLAELEGEASELPGKREMSGESSKSEIFARLIAQLQAETETTPLLLLVDDMHWSDLATRELLGLLAREMDQQRLLLVLTTRPEVSLEYPGARVRRIDLEPLAEPESLGLIDAHDPEQRLEASERREIAAACAGIPLFIECQVKSRLEGRHYQFSITEALQGELDCLGTHKRVLHVAAVLGNRFERRHLEALLPDADLPGALARAVGRRLVETPSAEVCVFRHALIRDAAYESVPVSRRKSLHEAVAHLFMAEAGAPDEIARHFTAAGCRDEAAAWWIKSGDEDMAREFAADAMSSYRQALELLQSAGVRQDGAAVRRVRMRLGYAAQVAEGYGSPLTYQLFLEMVTEIEASPEPDPGLLFAALCGCYMGSSSFGRDDGLRIARRLEGLARTEAERLMVCFALGNTLLWRGDFVEAAVWQRRGIELASRLPSQERLRYGVDDLAVTCRANLCWTLWFLGDEAGACAMAAEALREARKEGRAHGLCFALSFAVGLHWFRGDGPQVERLAGEALVLARQYRFPLWEGINSLFLLGSRARACVIDDKQPLFEAAALMQQAIPGRAQTCRWIVARALLDQGEWEEGEKLLDVALAEAPGQEEQYCQSDLLRLKGICLARRGQTGEAGDHGRQAVALARTQGATGLLDLFARLAAPLPVAESP